MAKKSANPAPAELDAARAAARNTDSGPASPAPAAAGKGDAPAQKSIDTQALSSGMRSNPNKAAEHGEANAGATPVGASVSPPSRIPTASTLS